MKKISIIGATIIGNRGAEAMLGTTIGRIKEKYPDSQFNIYSYYPNEDRKLTKNTDFVIHSATPLNLVAVLFPQSILLSLLFMLKINFLEVLFSKSVQDLADSDILIDLAGVSFMDGRAKFLPFNILTIWPAMILKTPVVKFAQGLGTFNQIPTKIAAKCFLPRCKQIFARGEITFNHLNLLFSKQKNLQIAGDVAFSHKTGDSLVSENLSYVDDTRNKLLKIKNSGASIIGFCPSSVVYAKSEKEGIDYIGTIVSSIKDLLTDDKLSILIFPNATREKNVDKLRNNDLPIIKKVADRLLSAGIEKDRIVYISKDINTDGIKTLLDATDINVVSRFHAMIASLSLAKPVMVLGWSHKYLEVMKQFDLSEWVVDYKSQELDLTKTIINMLSKKESLNCKIIKFLPAVKNESFKQFKFIFDEVL